jgi:trk system potassium uptake protein TrkA
MARQVYGVEHIVSWVRDPAQNARFRRLGAQVVNPAYSTVLILESMVLSPDAFSMTADIDEARAVREIKLQNRDLVGSRLQDLSLPGDVIVLMIERAGDVVVPDRETVLQANDTVTLVGQDGDIDVAARLFARSRRSPA